MLFITFIYKNTFFGNIHHGSTGIIGISCSRAEGRIQGIHHIKIGFIFFCLSNLVIQGLRLQKILVEFPPEIKIHHYYLI